MKSVFPLLFLLFLNSSHLEGNMGGVVRPDASASDTRDPQLFGRRRDDTGGAHWRPECIESSRAFVYRPGALGYSAWTLEAHRCAEWIQQSVSCTGGVAKSQLSLEQGRGFEAVLSPPCYNSSHSQEQFRKSPLGYLAWRVFSSALVQRITQCPTPLSNT